MNLEYYSPHGMLTRNAPLNIVVGGRGLGKTYGVKDYTLKREKKTVWVSRRDTEASKVAKGFLKDLPHRQDDFKLSWVTEKEDSIEEKKSKVKTVYPSIVNSYGEDIVSFTSLNVPNKGIPFNDTEQLIFDEFLILEGSSNRYLKNEINLFYDLVQTVARNKKNFRVIMIGNLIDWYNPYFANWGIEKINLDRRYTWIKKPDILLEIVPNNNKWVESYEQSAFGRIVDGTQYDQYMLGNIPLVNYNIEIKPHPPYARYMFNLINGNNILAVWNNFNYWYVTNQGVDKTKGAYVSDYLQAGRNRYFDSKVKRQIKELVSKNQLFGENSTSRVWLMEWLR